MVISSLPEFVETLRDSQLLSAKQTEDLIGRLQGRFTNPRELAQELLQLHWLTPYQINKILNGAAAQLVLGPYILLERLGQGAMGRVYKVRHRKLGRIAALKVLRKEKLAHPLAVQRFYREVQAVAQLSHPNIVMAYDAGEVAGTYFFAMEYVPGLDLALLIKQKGCLPVPSACDYIRQAALGLQHAHEKGFVHRDIKPSNLLLGPPSGADRRRAADFEPGSVIKILDMGLVRLQGPLLEGNGQDMLTQLQVLLGTPDFISPEQACDPRRADIRSDLYSLGCTFHYLLTGQVPFPGGSAMEKILKHSTEPPPPVEELRPEIPSAVGQVLRRMMAKAPEERYQTPAELADALATLLRLSRLEAPLRVATGPSSPPAMAVPVIPEVETVNEMEPPAETTDSPIISPRLRPGSFPRHRRRIWIVSLAITAGIVTVLTWILFLLAWANSR